MLRILDEYHNEDTATWTERDFLAIQRALQIYIESFIGMARYFVGQKYNLSVSQSREAVDELKSRGDLDFQQHNELLKLTAFRHPLVHDFLGKTDSRVQLMVSQKHYAIMENLFVEWHKELEQMA
ncbi:MAG: DUF86 domain-containing protein [Methylococcales bacterium]|nr:DUF86 domain-containing protein [Methylococcales bacterium]